MKFSIITPTFKRSEALARAVASVKAQTYVDWEMVIINDSPTDETYFSFVGTINDPRIRYFVNDRNRGVNFSRNFGLDHLGADSKWVIFLDDDDTLAPDTLKNFYDLILLHGEQKWFMTNRALKNGSPLTVGAIDENTYSYFWNYLFFKKIQGDATHCIETKLITQNHVRFLTYVKQAEEWFFFYQIGRHSSIFYGDHNSTITDGYDARSGLNFRKRTFEEKNETLIKIFYEATAMKIISGQFLLYMFLRSIKLLIGK
jgi:glycosyltransferase involved in cell wall biosynthesis